jgi:DNA-binding transcriptional LysR family regulator
MRFMRILGYVDEVARSGSIRKAAERLNLTASALNRRVMDIEEELGTLLFERRPRGVRLTSAGEVFLGLARRQLSDTERMRSQIEELKGLRRGVVRIAGSQALAHSFLPASLALFRKQFPMLSFDVRILDHESAMSALAAYEVDLVLVFRPPFMPNFRPLMALEQRLVALLPAGHPLSKRKTVRLRDCATYPMALPGRAIGGRQLLEEVAARRELKFHVVVESNSFEFLRSCVAGGGAISFQIEIGALPGHSGSAKVVARPIDDRDVPRADLVLGQLRERTLPIAAAKFAEHLETRLRGLRDEVDPLATNRSLPRPLRGREPTVRR